MRLLEERARGALRVRLTDCGCGEDDCDSRLVFAAVHPQLWIVAGVGQADHVADVVEFLLADEAVEGQRPLEMVAHASALVGLTWRELVDGGRARAVEQWEAFDGLPHWMLRVDVGRLWGIRGRVFGGPLTRVPRALQALHDAYDAGGAPARLQDVPRG